MLSTAPLDKFYISERNVRKTDVEFDVDQLAEDIAERGLLQNLVAVSGIKDVGPAKRGCYGVVAGGRRLRALWRLRDAGRIDPKMPVPFGLKDVDEGRECSLSENLQKVAMNAVDELQGYEAIIAGYADTGEVDPVARIARCAHHFGKTVRYIEQRLRLSGLAPAILDALRAGTLTLDSAKAYAAVSDQDLQMQVFKQMSTIEYAISGARHSVHAIRNALAGKTYRGTSRQVLYVGLDAYVAAGGRVERDLFMGADEGEVLLDTGLVDQLCRDKAEPEAWAIARELGFHDAALMSWSGVGSPPPTPRGYAAHGGAIGIKPERAADAILVCQISHDGGRIERTDSYFAPDPRPASKYSVGTSGLSHLHPAATPGGAAPARAHELAKGYESDTARLGRLRFERIELAAARLAAPVLAGTPLENEAVWPGEDLPVIKPIQRLADGDYAVAMLVRVPAAAVEKAMAAAERAFDRDESARAAAKAGLASDVNLAAPAAPDVDARTPEHAL